MKRFLGKILLAVAVPVLMLTILELGLRVATSGRLYLTEACPHEVVDGTYRLIPGFDGWWHGAHYRINADGFRMPEDVRGTTGMLRVLALGDSVTEGYCVPDVNDVWPMQLPALLDGTPYGPAYVINSGVAGWNLLEAAPSNSVRSGQFLPFLAGPAARYQPDVILYVLCMNDIPGRLNNLFDLKNAENKKRFKLFPESWRGFLKRKAFYRLARDGYRERKFHTLDFSAIPTPDLGEEYWTRIRGELAGLQDAARAMDARLACVIWPYSYQTLPANADLLEVNARIRAALEANGIPYRDLTGALNSTNVLDYYVLGDYIHPNAAGHLLIARAATDLIVELGATPRTR